jgi:transcriptional regulator GlxA family with amidase domain
VPPLVVLLAFDGANALDVTGPHEVFAGADRALRHGHRADDPAGYDVRVLTLDGTVVRTESGLGLASERLDPEALPTVDTLIVPGGDGVHPAAGDPRFVAAVRDLAGRSRRIVSVCTGVFALAAAGLVDGRTVTTHWARGRRLRERHPAVHVDTEPIWWRDGDVWTSAGVTAGIDVSLALVEDDHGPELATTVARWLVVYLRRPGGQSQFAGPVWRRPARTDPLRRVQQRIDADPAADHRVSVLAVEAAMSERHFLRRFTAETGTTPGQYVATARVDAARRELVETDDTVAVIARRVGFGTAESMRRTFVRHVGVAPDHYRHRFRTAPRGDTT